MSKGLCCDNCCRSIDTARDHPHEGPTGVFWLCGRCETEYEYDIRWDRWNDQAGDDYDD